MKQIIAYLFVLINTYGVLSQSNLGIKSAHTDSFQIEIDTQQLSYNYQSEYKILGLKSGPHFIRLMLDSLRTVEKAIYLEDGVEHWFELKVDSSEAKVKLYNTFPINQSDTITNGRAIIKLKELRKERKVSVKDKILDSTEQFQSDSSITLKIDSIQELTFEELYKGKRGCVSPISSFNTTLARIAKEQFNHKKMALAQAELQDKCLSIVQIQDLLLLFEFDDHKFEIICTLQNNIFDIDNIAELVSQFQLGRHKEKFRTLFNIE